MLKKEEGGNSVPLIYVSCKERVVPLDSHRITRGCYFQMNCFRHQRKSVLFPPEPDQVNIIRKHHKGIRVMVFNATFDNISVILWRSVYWWRKPEYPEKTTKRPAASHWQTLSQKVVSNTLRLSGIRIHNFSGDRYWLQR
jgi:hypothetical protein